MFTQPAPSEFAARAGTVWRWVILLLAGAFFLIPLLVAFRFAGIKSFGSVLGPGAATSAVMPPPAETEAAVAQLVPLLLVLLLVPPVLELEELQPTVSSRLPATAEAAAMACLARKILSQATVPAGGDQDADLG